MLVRYQQTELVINQNGGGVGQGLEKYHPPVFRYSYKDLVRRIEDALRESGKTPKAIQDEAGIPKDQWSRKMTPSETDGANRGNRASFSYDELTRLARALRAPEGWPFIEWSHAAALERALDALGRAPSPPLPMAAEEVAQPPRQKKTGHR